MSVRKLLTKKRKGSNQFVEASVISIILLLFLVLVIGAYSIWMSEFSAKEKIDSYATSAIKQLEIISPNDESGGNRYQSFCEDVKAELLAEGYKNVEVTYTAPAGETYGKNISITIKATYPVNNEKTNGFIKAITGIIDMLGGESFLNTLDIDINQTIKGTCKC